MYTKHYNELPQEQLDHLNENLALFMMDKGDSVEAYFAEHVNHERDALDLYLGVCSDLGLTPRGVTTEHGKAVLVADTTPTQPAQAPSIDSAALAEAMKEALGMVGGGEMTFEEALSQVDPRDSETALLMADWLVQTRRLQRVGVLDGGQGYLYVYQEPKGSTKAGYRPGGTQGGRMVDEALEKQREAGAKPRKTGLCPTCFSAVTEVEGVVFKEESGSPDDCTSGDGKHTIT